MRSMYVLMGALVLAVTGWAHAGETIVADVVIEYSPAEGSHLRQPYGGTVQQFSRTGQPWRLEDLSFAIDGNRNSFVSLPRGAVLILGFSDGVIFDGPGDDIFVAESGAASELADVYVSSDGGITFTLLGRAYGDRVTRMDLGTIGFTGEVNAVKVVGLDSRGDSPGFDLSYVQGLEGSVQTLGGANRSEGRGFSVGLGARGQRPATD
ncbi:MAG: hypothetical protein AAGK00_06125 [Pseudomonadota bacterium]